MSATPGQAPWTVRRGQLTTTIYDAREYPVALALPRPERAANARLISAAPDMLDALRKAVLALAHAYESTAMYKQECEVCDAAIKKATT